MGEDGRQNAGATQATDFVQALDALARRYPPVCTAKFKQQPEDFQVREVLGFALDGQGEHQWLRVRKRDLNTAAVAQVLAKSAGCALRDVGYSGMKDKHAVTEQWFSLPGEFDALQRVAVGEGGFEVIDVQRHSKKCRRGVHRSNEFTIVLREVVGERAKITSRMEAIGARGTPNYFGTQRFGPQGSNLAQAARWFGEGVAPQKHQRSMVLSAARSFLFNLQLSARLQAGRWETVQAGDVMQLAGSNSVFVAENLADAKARLESADISHSALLPGKGMNGVMAATALEQSTLAGWESWIAGLAVAGVRASRRATGLRPENLCWEWRGDENLQLTFSLPRGAFATSLLRELGTIRA